jgi:hypothetical protein
MTTTRLRRDRRTEQGRLIDTDARLDSEIVK